jgi:hypothetical protein
MPPRPHGSVGIHGVNGNGNFRPLVKAKAKPAAKAKAVARRPAGLYTTLTGRPVARAKPTAKAKVGGTHQQWVQPSRAARRARAKARAKAVRALLGDSDYDSHGESASPEMLIDPDYDSHDDAEMQSAAADYDADFGHDAEGTQDP